MLAGCVDVNGGAVELSWAIRTRDGIVSGCGPQDANLATVSLCARTVTTASEKCPIEGATWDCEARHGTTRFNVQEGEKELWIEVTCPDGSPANVTVPSPIVRDVAFGEVTQLDALLIQVNADGADAKACLL
jgi:hypothetical protein